MFKTTSQPEMFTESMWYTKANPPMAKKLSSFFPTNKDWANAFAECGFEIVSALNSLVPDMKHHFDPEGPFREEWRLGSCAFLCYSDEEERAALKPFIDLKEKRVIGKVYRRQRPHCNNRDEHNLHIAQYKLTLYAINWFQEFLVFKNNMDCKNISNNFLLMSVSLLTICKFVLLWLFCFHPC